MPRVAGHHRGGKGGRMSNARNWAKSNERKRLSRDINRYAPLPAKRRRASAPIARPARSGAPTVHAAQPVPCSAWHTVIQSVLGMQPTPSLHRHPAADEFDFWDGSAVSPAPANKHGGEQWRRSLRSTFSGPTFRISIRCLGVFTGRLSVRWHDGKERSLLIDEEFDPVYRPLTEPYQTDWGAPFSMELSQHIHRVFHEEAAREWQRLVDLVHEWEENIR